MQDPLRPDQDLSERYVLALVRNLAETRRSLQGDHESSYMPLYRAAMELYRIYWHDRKRFHAVTGYKTLNLLAVSELGLKTRSINYIMAIAKLLFVTLREHPELQQKIGSIGFTRLIHVVSLITPENAEAWYDFVMEHSHPEIKRAAADYRAALKAQENKPETINKTFEFMPLTST